MKQMNVSPKWITLLKEHLDFFEITLDQKQLDGVLNEIFLDSTKRTATRKAIVEASAIAAYQGLPHALSILLTDNAPQFQVITKLLALCWIHEGRHYKKLMPCFLWHQMQVNAFLKKFWKFYHALLEYKQAPNERKAKTLSKRFEVLFSEKTGYDALDKRISMTKSRKNSLLLVLQYPELPLHNNASELGTRAQARKRDISLHTMSHKGTEAKDTFMTIVETAKKLGVNVYHYLYDRITQKYELPSLADLIKRARSPDRSKNLALPQIT